MGYPNQHHSFTLMHDIMFYYYKDRFFFKEASALQTTSISKRSQEKTIRAISPFSSNIRNNTIFLNFSTSQIGADYALTLYNLSGAVQRKNSGIKSSSTIALDYSGLANGLYLLSIRVGKEQFSQKVMIGR